MNAAPVHHLFLAAPILGMAMILLGLWIVWPAPGDAGGARAAGAGLMAGALCFAANAGVAVWRWRRASDTVDARYRKWTAVASGCWAIVWAVASPVVRAVA